MKTLLTILRVLAVLVCFTYFGCISNETASSTSDKFLIGIAIKDKLVALQSQTPTTERDQKIDLFLKEYYDRTFAQPIRNHRVIVAVFDINGTPLSVSPTISKIKLGNPWVPNSNQAISHRLDDGMSFEIDWDGYDACEMYIQSSGWKPITLEWFPGGGDFHGNERKLLREHIFPGTQPLHVEVRLEPKLKVIEGEAGALFQPSASSMML